jgi:hypothetical protein
MTNQIPPFGQRANGSAERVIGNDIAKEPCVLEDGVYGRTHKYNARETEYNGIVYPSKAEAARAAELDLLKRVAAIEDWWRPEPIVLVQGRTRRETITYRADFCVRPREGPDWLEDVKGVITREFRLKMKLLHEKYPHLVVKVIQNGQEVRL